MSQKPEVWMIQISDNPRSMYYRGRVEESWSDYNLKFFNAITPQNPTKNEYLTFGKKRDTIEFTDTEISVWYSHAELWAKARKKPILIIEHDALLLEPIPDEIFDHDMVCLGHHRKPDIWLPGLAYYLTPKIANDMVRRAKSSKIDANSDSFIHQYCERFGVFECKYAYQVQNKSIGTTIEHRKK